MFIELNIGQKLYELGSCTNEATEDQLFFVLFILYQ